MAAECACDDDTLIGVFVHIDDVLLTLDRSEVRVQQGEVRRGGRQRDRFRDDESGVLQHCGRSLHGRWTALRWLSQSASFPVTGQWRVPSLAHVWCTRFSDCTGDTRGPTVLCRRVSPGSPSEFSVYCICYSVEWLITS